MLLKRTRGKKSHSGQGSKNYAKSTHTHTHTHTPQRLGLGVDCNGFSFAVIESCKMSHLRVFLSNMGLFVTPITTTGVCHRSIPSSTQSIRQVSYSFLSRFPMGFEVPKPSKYRLAMPLLRSVEEGNGSMYRREMPDNKTTEPKDKTPPERSTLPIRRQALELPPIQRQDPRAFPARISPNPRLSSSRHPPRRQRPAPRPASLPSPQPRGRRGRAGRRRRR